MPECQYLWTWVRLVISRLMWQHISENSALSVKPKSHIMCDMAMPSGMWSNPTAVYRLIDCQVIGSTRMQNST